MAPFSASDWIWVIKVVFSLSDELETKERDRQPGEDWWERVQGLALHNMGGCVSVGWRAGLRPPMGVLVAHSPS